MIRTGRAKSHLRNLGPKVYWHKFKPTTVVDLQFILKKRFYFTSHNFFLRKKKSITKSIFMHYLLLFYPLTCRWCYSRKASTRQADQNCRIRRPDVQRFTVNR